MNLGKKRWGCFRTGCLAGVVVAVGLPVAIWLLLSSGRSLPDHFVLRLPLGGMVEERQPPVQPFSFMEQKSSLSLQEAMTALDRARTDRRVRSILLEIDGLEAPPAKIGQLSRSVLQVRKAGKKVVAFLRSPQDKDYLLATACDSVIVQRGSFLQLDGLRAELFFFAEPLKKLGIAFQAAQWKEYKSGVEPFTRTSASKEYREQVQRILDDSYDEYLDSVSRRRGMSRTAFEQVIDSMAVLSPEKAVALGLVDRTSSLWQLEKGYERKLGTTHGELFVGGRDYVHSTGGMAGEGKGDRIALISITGPIAHSSGYGSVAEGDGTDEGSVRQAVDSALEDSKVKAIVVRIDSPGGDAFAAANMLEMLESARKKKPVVASMSGVAASGGYMVALAADRIFAEPLTITGSIGVYALKPDFSGLMEKTGVGREVISHGRYADASTPYKPFDEAALGKFVEASGAVYHDFTAKVAIRRKLTPEQVEAVAGGRVWTGRRALEVGLVDRMGGLADAVNEARRLARMDTTKTPLFRVLPAEKSWIEYLFDGNRSAAAERIAVNLAAGAFNDLLPLRTLFPVSRTARMLLQPDGPKVLAIEPTEIVIR